MNLAAAFLLAAGAAAAPPPPPFQGESCAVCHQSVRDADPKAARPVAEPDGAFDVVVVGAGMSGLAAAHFLKSDFNVLVLEKEDRAGGKIRREAFASGRRHPVAGVYMGEPGGPVKRLFDELGLRPRPIPEPSHQMFFEGRFQAVWWEPTGAAMLPYQSQVRGRFHRLGDDLKRLSEAALLTVPIDNSDAQALERYDRVTFRAHLEREYGPEAAEFGDVFSLDMFGAKASEVSAAAGLLYMAAEFEPGMSFDGGIGAASEAAAAALGARLRTGRLVDRVAAAGGGVEVESRDAQGRRFRATARAAVLAVPSMVALRIAPGLSAGKRDALAAVRYSAYAVAALDLKEAIYSKAYVLWTPGRVFTDLTFPARLDGQASKPSDGQAVVAYVPFGADGRRALESTTDDELLRRVYADLDGVFPGASKKVVEARVLRWGHAMPVLGPGQLTAARAKLVRPEPPLFFAGVETEAPMLEGAVQSGFRAARQVRELLAPAAPSATP